MVFSMGNGGDMKHRVIIRQRVVTGMISKRTFPPQFTGIDIPLQHKFGFSRNLQIVCDAPGHDHRLLPDKARQENLVDASGHGGGRGVYGGRIRADSDRYRHAPVSAPVFIQIVRPVLMDMPVHAGGVSVKYLHSIHAEVLPAGFKASGENERQGDKGARICRPAMEYRELG